MTVPNRLHQLTGLNPLQSAILCALGAVARCSEGCGSDRQLMFVSLPTMQCVFMQSSWLRITEHTFLAAGLDVQQLRFDRL